MGEEAKGDHNLVSASQTIATSPFVLAEQLQVRYELSDNPAFDALYDHLVALSCRDQNHENDGSSAEIASMTLSERRSKAYVLAQSVRRDAEIMLACLQRIHANLSELNHDVLRANPSLLEAVFEVDAGGPEDLEWPDEICVLNDFFRHADDDDFEQAYLENSDTAVSVEDLGCCPPDLWDKVDARLTRLAAIPIRPKLARGPFPDKALQSAVSSIKAFWKSEGRGWAMSSLKHAQVRKEGSETKLAGVCEEFVRELLIMCGIDFTLAGLASAWSWVDQNGA